MTKSFPPVQPGGSLILAWQVRDKNVLVVGGGEVSPDTYCYANAQQVTLMPLFLLGCRW